MSRLDFGSNHIASLFETRAEWKWGHSTLILQVGDPVETAYFEGFASGPKVRSIPARASGPRQWSKRKNALRAESPIPLTSRLWKQYANGAGFQPLFQRAKRYDLIRYPIDGLRPSLVCDGPLALKSKKTDWRHVPPEHIYMQRLV